MANLTTERDTVQMACDARSMVIPVKTKTTIFQGSIVAIDATGFAVPGKKAAGLTCVGRAEETVTNTGADGAATISVSRGVFVWDNSGTNAITAALLLQPCYMEDDQTVGSLATGASPAGIIVRVDDAGVAVDTTMAPLITSAGAGA